MNSRGRRILSILLLLLYGFIITPVVLWHSHACETTFQPGKKQATSAKQWGKPGHSCSICEHAYSSYPPADDASEVQPSMMRGYISACSVYRAPVSVSSFVASFTRIKSI